MAVEAEQPDPILTAARRIAFLPVVHGGLGLRSSALLSPAAYWAAWADMLPTLVERVPDLAEQVLQELESGDSRIVSVAQAADLGSSSSRPRGNQGRVSAQADVAGAGCWLSSA